jgi:hypothetical protein
MSEGNSSSPIRTSVRPGSRGGPGVCLVCGACGAPIDSDSGWIVVDLDDVMERERAWRSFRADNPGPHSIGQLLALPRRIEWKAWHRACDPDIESNAYYIESGSLTTWAQVAHWTAHLMEKSWLSNTNWDDVLRGLASGSGILREAAA